MVNFKKISAIAAGVLMAGLTMGTAAAANYPTPFVSGGAADVAIVYGTGDGVSALDVVEAGNIQSNLQSYMGASSSDTTTTTSGETYALFSGGNSRLWMNESIGSQRSTVTKTELPTILADGDWEGDTSADYSQIIEIGSNNYALLDFGKHPTSEDDPTIAYKLSETASTEQLYNLTVTFDQNVSLISSDSIGARLDLFGKQFTVGAGSTKTKLYLYESSETVSLSIGGNSPSSSTVTVNGEEYTVELVTSTDSAATIKVTDSAGNSDSKEISEDASKKIQGIDIGVDLADEDSATNRLLADITIGANKVLLQNGNRVKIGSDEDGIDGTYVYNAGNDWNSITEFRISVAAENSDVDALKPGESFVDPVFGGIKIVFSSVEYADDTETIRINSSGGDKMKISMNTHDGSSGSMTWYYNDSRMSMLGDDSDDPIYVLEQAELGYHDYVVVGNEDEGFLLEFSEYSNDSDSRDDTITFKNAFDSTQTYSVSSITTEGTGNLIVGGVTHTVNYTGTSTSNAKVRINMKDSGAGNLTVFPTIETSKGAKLAFYNATYIDLSDIDGAGTDCAGLKFPDGNGYTGVAISADTNWANNTWVIGGKLVNATTTSGMNGTILTVGQLTYYINGTGTANQTVIKLLDVEGNEIENPAIVIFEEEDDNNEYQALITKIDLDSGSSTKPIGVSDVETTYMNDAGLTYSTDWDNIQYESDDNLYADMDLWGTKIITDKSTAGQNDVTIIYPNNQVNALVYVAENDATITTSSSSSSATQLGDVLAKDSEVSSVSSKNLIVVGGSCINSAAATLLGGAYCGASFTDKTGVGSGKYIIKGYSDSSLTNSGKVALLVAGYEAADTVNAATYLRTQTVDTSSEYIGTSSTSAVEQTE